MGRTKKIGSTGGLGARYGVTVRKRYIETMAGLKAEHKCPQCGSNSVLRVSTGLWNCRKCGLNFSGGAYTPTTKLGVVAKRAAKGLTIEAEVTKESK